MKTARACWSTMDCLSWFFFVRKVGLEGEGGGGDDVYQV